MKIAICGSMATPDLVADIFDAGKVLQDKGFDVLLPEAESTSDYTDLSPEEIADRKNHFIKAHFYKIEESNAILVTNGAKKGIEGYIGANTLMEMTVAAYLNKKIYVLNPVSESLPAYQEILGMKPVFLNGNLEDLK